MAQRAKNGSYNKSPRGRASKGLTPITWAGGDPAVPAHLAGPAEASPYTYDHYRRDLEHFEDWWKGEPVGVRLELDGLVGSDLRNWKEFLKSDPIDQQTGRTRKPAAINAKLAALRSFLGWAEDNRLVAEAPEVPKRVKESRLAYKAVPRIERKRLLRAVEAKRVKRDMAPCC